MPHSRTLLTRRTTDVTYSPSHQTGPTFCEISMSSTTVSASNISFTTLTSRIKPISFQTSVFFTSLTWSKDTYLKNRHLSSSSRPTLTFRKSSKSKVTFLNFRYGFIFYTLVWQKTFYFSKRISLNNKPWRDLNYRYWKIFLT